MGIVKKYSKQFEQKIRQSMSPMEIREGDKVTKVPYKGDLTLEAYISRVVPDSRDQIIPYLVLREYEPVLSDRVAALLEATHQQEEACKKQDFEKGAKIRDDKRKIRKGLLKLMNKK